MLSEPVAVTLRVIAAFEGLDVPYWIGGSLASALYGTARSTLDTDLIADLKIEQVAALAGALNGEFYADATLMVEAVVHGSSFNVVHLKTLFKVDVFLLKSRPFDQMQLQRRRLQTIAVEPERRAYVCTAEDIILAKLEWYRLGNEVSDRQWRDILGVLKVQAGLLDLDYLQQWAGELGVTDLLHRALGETA